MVPVAGDFEEARQNLSCASGVTHYPAWRPGMACGALPQEREEAQPNRASEGFEDRLGVTPLEIVTNQVQEPPPARKRSACAQTL
ncbi:MAG: hypothetical protein WBD40_23850 [Tepidisphaeraceae bacterium]